MLRSRRSWKFLTANAYEGAREVTTAVGDAFKSWVMPEATEA
jgi:hypothetical protein